MTLQELAESLSKSEQSVILYLESCLVEQSGLFRARAFNEADWKLIERFEKVGLFVTHQIPSAAARKIHGTACTHWVDFTDSGWLVAQAVRRLRADRVRANCQNFVHIKAHLEQQEAPPAASRSFTTAMQSQRATL